VNLYYLAFPLGFTVSFLLHWLINTLFPPSGLGMKDDRDYYQTFSPDEADRLGVATDSPFEGEEQPYDAYSSPDFEKGASVNHV
jgi:NCS1 family nucleobase:cation symporter-1